LAARHNKSRKVKEQPLQADVANLMRVYLRDKPAGQPVWGGTWARHRTGAEMLRLDLEAAGIPYAVEGPDGPLFADFHALRHSYLTLGGRSGIDLRTLQELAGHSDPSLTARYSHRRLYDLAGAVDKLPRLLPTDADRAKPAVLQATGTDGACTALARTGDRNRDDAEGIGSANVGEAQNTTGPNRLQIMAVGAGQQDAIGLESRAGDRIRTGDVQLGKSSYILARKPATSFPDKMLGDTDSADKSLPQFARIRGKLRPFSVFSVARSVVAP
jgi:hypothetical protein